MIFYLVVLHNIIIRKLVNLEKENQTNINIEIGKKVQEISKKAQEIQKDFKKTVELVEEIKYFVKG